VVAILATEQIVDVLIVEPDSHGDSRGRFVESYRRNWFPLGREMVQGNRSEKEKNAIVGFHYHLHQADYWYPLRGKLRVILVDLRIGSPTEKNLFTIDLDGAEDRGIFIPPGVAHGFSTITDVLLTYMVDGYYNQNDELGVAYNDPELAADWLIENPIVSNRDMNNPLLKDIPSHLVPHYPMRT
jgi:dTDP-4-dehydrorhamnose 3,5-epimerase